MARISDTIIPDAETLSDGLSDLFGRFGTHEQLNVISRTPHIHSSTHPLEIVRCRRADDEEIDLVCKYGHLGYSAALGNRRRRGGVDYEIRIYRDILSLWDCDNIKFHGDFEFSNGNNYCFVMDYLDDAYRLNQCPNENAILDAASWIGKFHLESEKHLQDDELPPLICYDKNYFLDCINRVYSLPDEIHGELNWLRRLCTESKRHLDVAVSGSQVLIHGEYYPKNILVQGNCIYPVDWESAAIAMGEIDLATLTEGWSIDVCQEIYAAYAEARWPADPPEDLTERVEFARLYDQLRWLGEQGSWKISSRNWRFEELRRVGERLAII